MKAMGEYIHSRGLKYGLYSSAGEYTCEGRAGSLGNEEVDAKTWAEWGIDYIKYDNCYN
jgi:alpha-galactosidase